MWYSGDIGSAVATVQKESKILLVFGMGEDAMSIAVDGMFKKASEILLNTLNKKCICLRLEKGTEGFNQFCEFWPILTTPIIHFITGGGGKLCEPLIGEVTEKDILQAIHQPAQPIQQNITTPSTSNTPSTSMTTEPEQPVESEAEKRARIAERSDEYRAKIDEVRAKKEAASKEAEKAKETERRRIGQQIAEQKRIREEKELLDAAKEKRKDKASDAEHLKKLRAQIAQDRANRAKHFETVSKEEKEANDEKIRKIKDEKLREEREKLEEQRRMRDTMARIQFRFYDGSTATSQFEATQKLADARSYLVANDLVQGEFILGVAMPRRRFTSEDEEGDFRSLGLTPSAVLTVLPAASSSSGGNNRLLTIVLAVLYFPIDILISILNSIFGQRKPPVSDEPAQNQAHANRNNSDVRRRRRGGDFSDDEDRPTYNGNSTQQL